MFWKRCGIAGIADPQAGRGPKWTMDVEGLRPEAKGKLARTLEDLRKDHSKAVEGAVAAVGGTFGAGASLMELCFAGALTGCWRRG